MSGKRRVYYSAAYRSRDDEGAWEAVLMLKAAGLEVCAPWMTAEHEDETHDRAEYARRMALLDLEAMEGCQVFIEDRRWGQSRHGSMHYERGRAVGLGLHVIVIGEPESVFDHDPVLTFVDSVEGAVRVAASPTSGREGGR